ncbi:MAG: hypothetical protein WBD30_14945 [Bacteroidota bacterium]
MKRIICISLALLWPSCDLGWLDTAGRILGSGCHCSSSTITTEEPEIVYRVKFDNLTKVDVKYSKDFPQDNEVVSLTVRSDTVCGGGWEIMLKRQRTANLYLEAIGVGSYVCDFDSATRLEGWIHAEGEVVHHDLKEFAGGSHPDTIKIELLKNLAWG